MPARFSSVLSVCSSSDKNKTFKPLKNHPKNGKRHKLSEYAKATLGSGNMRSAVVLPKGEDLCEWLAVNSECPLLFFYQSIHLPHSLVRA